MRLGGIPSAGAVAGKRLTVMPLGDSITAGVGSNGGYRSYLLETAWADGKDLDYVGTQSIVLTTSRGSISPGHNGFPGYCISATPEPRLGIQEITPYPNFVLKPDVVLLHIGVNDLNYVPWQSTMVARLGTLLDSIFAFVPGVMIVLAKNTTYGQPATQAGIALQTYRDAMPAIVAARNAAGQRMRLVDMTVLDGATEIADGIHPNALGYAHMATVWYPAIKDLL